MSNFGRLACAGFSFQTRENANLRRAQVFAMQPIFPVSSPFARAPRLQNACVLVVLAAGLLGPHAVWAQNAAPFALTPATAPTARSVNVLIVALDDAVVLPSDAAITGALPSAPSDVPLTGITPARLNNLQPEWRVFAKKDPKPDRNFDPVPQPPSKAPILSGPSGALSPSRVPSNTFPQPNLIPETPFLPARPLAAPGRAMLAAIPLARSLGALGYADVQTTSPDGSILARALGEKRLAPGTLSALRDALRSLQSATKLPVSLRKTSLDLATKRANDAASAIGQATGYRAVVALYVSPFDNGASPYTIVLNDSARESGEPILWSETAADEATARGTGAATGAALLHRSLDNWNLSGLPSAKSLADLHMERARAAATANNPTLVQEEVTRITALDPTRSEAFVLLGDTLASTDLSGAAAAYKRALALNARDGATFEKMAIAYAGAPVPDWLRTLEAGQKALALGTDSSNLRLAMARAQFGRADAFRKGQGYAYKADDAESEAQVHLDRVLQLSPDNPEALRLLARALLATGRTSEAVQTLDRVVPLFPNDFELQRQYAGLLVNSGDRKEDAFVAYGRLWKMSAVRAPIVDPITYSALIQGFDEHVFNLGKSARQLSDGVSTASIGRESAVLQLARLKSDMSDAETTISSLKVPGGFSAVAATARQFAATLMNQALENHQTFLDTGQDVYKTRAAELYRQAVAQLNTARNAK